MPERLASFRYTGYNKKNERGDGMRILILSANTGEGHNSTAKALMEVLERDGVSCDLRDSLACLSPRFSKFICNWHARIYRYSPKLADAGYETLERIGPEPDRITPVYEILSLGADKLWKLIMAGDYDAVICTHVFSGMMMTEVRNSRDVHIPCFFVATDYTCSPTVEQCDVDGYFIPAASLEYEFVRAGLPADRMIPSGIPVRQAFYHKTEKTAAREKLHLPQTGKVVLLMCGSMGCGPMKKVAQEMRLRLPADAVVVAICGNNERLYETMAELQDERFRVLGFTDAVAEYMDAADLIITKPGGLSTTEAANKHLPMVLINAVGGCERPNFRFFLESGCATGSDRPDEVVALACELAADDERLMRIRNALEAGFRQNSAELIAKHVMHEGETYRAEKIRRQSGMISAENGHPSSQKGGCEMENNVTVQNLARSFAGESQARMRYTIYAQVARKEGYEWIARVFEETAANEEVHAEEFLEHLQQLDGCSDNIELAAGYPFRLGTTEENLAYAAAGELQEHDQAYPEFAEMARREGHDDTARLWMQIARIEGVHHNTFRELHEQMLSGTLSEKEKPAKWRCLNCGYTYEGIRACDPCPVCGKPAGWQEGDLDEKNLMPKK